MNLHQTPKAGLNGGPLKQPTLGVEILKGPKPGPKVAICVLVHGNEIAGWAAHDTVLSLCGVTEKGAGLKRGEVTLIIGNPEAHTIKERFVNHDLNRSFLPEHLELKDTASYEIKRFQQIESYLRDMDIVIDVHTSSQPTPPFVIGLDDRRETVNFMKDLGLGYVTSNWEPFIKGTLSEWPLRFNQHAVSVAVECGLHDAEESAVTASMAVTRALVASGVIDPVDGIDQAVDAIDHLRIVDAVMPRNPKNFRYVETLSGISRVDNSKLIAWDGEHEVRAPDMDNAVVLLPATERHIAKNPQDSAVYFGEVDDRYS